MSTETGMLGLQGIGAIAGVTGNVHGIISSDIDVWDPIAGAEIVAEPVLESEQPVPSVLGRRGVQQVSHDVVEQAARQKGAVTSRTDVHGRFAIATREQAAGWRVFACFSEIHSAGAAKAAPLGKEVCFDLGVFAASKPIGAVIPEALYCTLKKLADQWTVCGRVTDCGSGMPFVGAQVTARDVDMVQDDVLGTAPTSASGVYRIDYPGSAFRRGTWLDVELFGGPDVYFTVGDGSGGTLLKEDRSQGREPGRADRDCCGRIDLCVKVGVQPDDGTTLANVWTGVGNHTLPDSAGLNGWDALGHVGLRYALTSVVKLRGTVDRSVNGWPVEYRFLVSSAPTDNGGPEPADDGFVRVVGLDTLTSSGLVEGKSLFSGGTIGYMVRYNPARNVKIDVWLEDLADGWVRIDRCIERVFGSTPGLSPADIPSFVWSPADLLLGLNASALCTAPEVSQGTPGVPVPTTSQIPLQRFGVRFHVRRVDPADPNHTIAMPGDGRTLNSMAVNANAAYLALAVHDGNSTVTCQPAHGPVSLAYTAYHPYLGTASLLVTSNVGTVALDQSPVSGNTSLAVTESVSSSLPVPGLTRCGYLAKLIASRRLTDGETQASWNEQPQTFYFDPTP